ENFQALRPQRAAGADDIRDGIRDAELDARLDGAIEADHLDLDARASQKVTDEVDVARRNALAREVVEVAKGAGRAGETEGRVAEVQGRDFLRGAARIEQEVPARDADVERPRTDVGRDVARAQIEELDSVALVEDVERARVASLRV